MRMLKILCSFILFTAGFSLQASEDSFTGKILKNKVRLRLQPNLDSPVIREVNKDDLFVVVEDTDEFYAIKPPTDFKAYIYRTFVLDNVIEGSRVNVRLEPNLDAPVIAQLNTGDRVNGKICPMNSKWLEIAPPESARLYVCKEYVEKVGDVHYIAHMAQRKEEAQRLLNSAFVAGQAEMQKPFDSVNISGALDGFTRVMAQYPECSEYTARAKEWQAALQEAYVQKKIAFLESRKTVSEILQNNNNKLAEELVLQHIKIRALEEQLSNKTQEIATMVTSQPLVAPVDQWQEIEHTYYLTWAELRQSSTLEDFYAEQAESAVVLRGVVQPYSRTIKNKPGNYVLLNSHNCPVAYLYSTQVSLQECVGQEITVQASLRPNNNYAFPAYFVLALAD